MTSLAMYKASCIGEVTTRTDEPTTFGYRAANLRNLEGVGQSIVDGEPFGWRGNLGYADQALKLDGIQDAIPISAKRGTMIVTCACATRVVKAV